MSSSKSTSKSKFLDPESSSMYSTCESIVAEFPIYKFFNKINYPRFLRFRFPCVSFSTSIFSLTLDRAVRSSVSTLRMSSMSRSSLNTWLRVLSDYLARVSYSDNCLFSLLVVVEVNPGFEGVVVDELES